MIGLAIGHNEPPTFALSATQCRVYSPSETVHREQCPGGVVTVLLKDSEVLGTWVGRGWCPPHPRSQGPAWPQHVPLLQESQNSSLVLPLLSSCFRSNPINSFMLKSLMCDSLPKGVGFNRKSRLRTKVATRSQI